MSDITDRTLALADLIRLVQPAVEPVLTATAGGEVETILDKYKRASTWTPNTYFATGAIVLPRMRNGRRYRAAQGGVSDNATQSIVSSVSVTAPGSGYTSAPTVAFTGGGGSGASGIALIASGLVTAIILTSKGTGYTSAPTIALTGGVGTGATATASITGLEPSWPKTQGGKVADGASDPQLIWEEFGPDFENIYDVRAAAYECWMLKAEKSSNNFGMKLGSLGFERQQIHEQCKMMAQQFASVSIG